MSSATDPERSQLEHLADLAELAGPLVHEVNDFLNAMLLHCAVLERQLPSEFHGELSELVRQARAVAQLARQWQQFRRRPLPAEQPVDLNTVIERVLERLRLGPCGPDTWPALAREETDGIRLNVHLAAEPLMVNGHRLDLERLCWFLIVNAARAADRPAGEVRVQTTGTSPAIKLVVVDNGPSPVPETEAWAGTSAIPTRGRCHPLELSACPGLARRVGATLVANNTAAGLVVTVQFPQIA